MYRILIVDDESLARKWLQLVFRPYPEEFEVVGAACNGREALDFCRKQSVDIVITDMIMSDLDGIGFIQALREGDLDTQVIILSNHANFSMAQRGMSFGAAEYLLKGEITEEDLLAVVRRVCTRHKRLMQGRQAETQGLFGITQAELARLVGGPPDEGAAAKLEAGLAACNGEVLCAVFRADPPAKGLQAGVLSGSELALHLSDALRRQFLPNTTCVITDRNLVALLCVREGMPNAIKAAMVEVQGEHLSAGIGKEVRNVSAVATSFAQACSALHKRFFEGPGMVHRFLLSDEAPTRHFLNDGKHFADLAAGGEFGRLRAELEAFAQQRHSFSAADVDQVRRLFNTLAERMLQQVQLHRPAPVFPDVNPLAEVCRFHFFDDLLAWFFALMDQCADLHAESANDTSIRRAIGFIEDNYMQNLSLAAISEVAGFSPNYFCNVFKAYTGKSITAYLTETRIAAAKRMLTATSKSVHIIAGLVGYESASYFIKMFKKSTGMTPNHFRRINSR